MLRNRNTIEFLGICESIHNSKFNSVEFDTVKKEVGLNAFTISPSQWIKKTNAIEQMTILVENAKEEILKLEGDEK